LVKTVEAAANSDLSAKGKESEGAESDAAECKPGVPVLFFGVEPTVHGEDADNEKEEFKFWEESGAVGLKEGAERMEECVGHFGLGNLV
jgi:hypothetical protein